MPRRSSTTGRSRDAAAVDPDVARVERDQPVDHLQRGRLAAAGRADEHAERAGRDLEREVVERRRVAARVALRHVVEDDLGGARVVLTAARFLIPARPIDAARARAAPAVIAIASRKPARSSLFVGAGDRGADDRDPEQAGDARDRVVDAARDAGVALAGVGEHRRGERRDDHRQADREDEQRRAGAPIQ